jgi:hypothetical protein
MRLSCQLTHRFRRGPPLRIMLGGRCNFQLRTIKKIADHPRNRLRHTPLFVQHARSFFETGARCPLECGLTEPDRDHFGLGLNNWRQLFGITSEQSPFPETRQRHRMGFPALSRNSWKSTPIEGVPCNLLIQQQRAAGRNNR